MEDQFDRTRKLIGNNNIDRLMRARVLVFGAGGVGSYVCEALSRAGVGTVDVVDKDRVDITNINRQLIATHDTIGRLKAEVMRERMLLINPKLESRAFCGFYASRDFKGDAENIITADQLDFCRYDYIVDCVDNVAAKIDIICEAKSKGVAVISSMGTGNKLEPTMFEVCDIEKTSICPLAKVIRKELRHRGIKDVRVLYSKEEPKTTEGRVPASISFVPSCAGLIIAGEVIKGLME